MTEMSDLCYLRKPRLCGNNAFNERVHGNLKPKAVMPSQILQIDVDKP